MYRLATIHSVQTTDGCNAVA